jgi:citrate lyase subunit beta/citryl-CoA lyase
MPRRSVLVLPGSSERFLNKAPSIDADMVLLDLEDAVAPSEKPAARKKVVAAVRDLDFSERVLGVRLNAWSSPFLLRDVLEVVGHAGERLDLVTLPKVETPGQVAALDLLLAQVEAEAGLQPGHLGIEVQIESALGLQHVREICEASPRTEAVVLGPIDLAASLGMPMLNGGDDPDYSGDRYHTVHLALLVAARVAGIQVIDGPYLRLGDLAGLELLARRTRALGFDGKWAIHPEQVGTLNAVFSPEPAEVERALSILAALDAGSEREGRGALRDGGEMLDEASRKVALVVVARARRQRGLARDDQLFDKPGTS